MNFAEFLENIENVNKIIDPATKKPYRHSALFEKLKVIMADEITKGVPEENLWVNFTNTPRLSPAPHRAFDDKETPHGIFAYPLKYFIDHGSVPYAGDRDFCIVFKSKDPILDIGTPRTRNYLRIDISKMKDENIPIERLDFPEKKRLIQITSDMGIDLREMVARAAKKQRFSYQDPIPQQFLYRVLEEIAREWQAMEYDKTNLLKKASWPMKWNALLRKIGINNVVDLQDSGAVHTSEPTQGAFLNPKTLEVIEVVINKRGVSQESETKEFGKENSLANPVHKQNFTKSQKRNNLYHLSSDEYSWIRDEDKQRAGLSASYRNLIYNFKNQLISWGISKIVFPKDKLIKFRNVLRKLVNYKTTLNIHSVLWSLNEWLLKTIEDPSFQTQPKDVQDLVRDILLLSRRNLSIGG